MTEDSVPRFILEHTISTGPANPEELASVRGPSTDLQEVSIPGLRCLLLSLSLVHAAAEVGITNIARLESMVSARRISLPRGAFSNFIFGQRPFLDGQRMPESCFLDISD